MDIFSVFAIAVALAMDACAVCIGAGCSLPKLTLGHFVRMAGAFGFFQFAMPLAGYALGHYVQMVIEGWDHWIAFALLLWVGASMIRESFNHESEHRHSDPSRGRTLIMLAVATSLDAMAVGLSFALINMPPLMPSVIIGIVCAVISAAGLYFGSQLARAKWLKQRASLIGGLVLICIGIKILAEHHTFG